MRSRPEHCGARSGCRVLVALVAAICACAPAASRAQEIPPGTTPRGLVFAFLNETASAADSVNRTALRPRLVGELGAGDPRSFKGLIPVGARFRIDSMPELPSWPGRQRVLAYASVDADGERENWYLYCTGDTLWRLEALCRFPTALERAQIHQSLTTLDTTTPRYRLVRAEFERLLLPDDSLRAILRRGRADAEKLLGQLRKGNGWTGFNVRDTDFGALEEYRELDDDINPNDLIFYTIDRAAMERLKRNVGVRRIERLAQYPDLVFFVAGAIGGGSYGYLNAPKGTALPELSPDGFFMLKQVAEGWWLYKKAG